MRPIDGDALIVAIEQMMKHQIDADDICEMIQNFPPIEPERKKGKWIPCSERLPERGKDVLVTRDYDGREDSKETLIYSAFLVQADTHILYNGSIKNTGVVPYESTII